MANKTLNEFMKKLSTRENQEPGLVNLSKEMAMNLIGGAVVSSNGSCDKSNNEGGCNNGTCNGSTNSGGCSNGTCGPATVEIGIDADFHYFHPVDAVGHTAV